jgi:hypothetical protein
MKNTLSTYSIIIAGAILITSCSKTGPAGANGANGSQGPAGPVLTGTITGYVLLTNIYGDPVTTNLTAATIHLYNSTTNVEVDSVNANSAGEYTIPNVQTGNYNMICEYPGYGNAYHISLNYVGGTLTEDNKLAQIPVFTVTSAGDSVHLKNDNLYFYGKLTADPGGARTLLVFVGSSPNTNSSPANYVYTFAMNIQSDSADFKTNFALPGIYTNGFQSGNTVYFAIYPAANNYGNGSYTDPVTGRVVYTAIAATPYAPYPTLLLP